jgi:LmbE family N-acetylglucosaminyl deacetylase
MLPFGLDGFRRVLCLGAHADDIEIGCGGTLLRMIGLNPELSVRWVVFSGDEVRAAEARASAAAFLRGVADNRIDVHGFRDSFFPAAWGQIKEQVAAIAREFSPDVIFTHRRDDAHQDHRVLAELTWCAFRDHLILECEIPKYEGDLGQPNVFVPLSSEQARAKAEMIHAGFLSQRSHRWFTADTFLALSRLRGVECNATEQHAEGFYCRKLVL